MTATAHLPRTALVACDVVYRFRRKHRPPITLSDPQKVAEHMRPHLGTLAREEFWVLYLAPNNDLAGKIPVSRGTLDASLAHPREVFTPALLLMAASIILCHNHPSGQPLPSQEDVSLTHQLVEAGRILGIPVQDHVIVTHTTYTSFAEQSLL